MVQVSIEINGVTTMLTLNLGDLTPERFLAEFWQQKPLVIRQGFADFEDLIDAESLAGLAMDEAAESRIVYREGEEWQAEFGPFNDYSRLGETGWSLLIQGVDHWSPAVSQLITPFRFIPNWRLDDVMVGYSTPQGGVGPHIDHYDVFICQGSGRRHWRVGDRGNYKEFAAHPALLHVEDFEPIIDVVLEPGDILYIPPGFPHDGISLETSMSFSVGFRTNSARDLLSGLADHLIDNELGNQLIEDPQRPLSHTPGQIDHQDLTRITDHLAAMVNDQQLVSEFAGRFLSQAKHSLDLPAEPLDYSPEELAAAIEEGTPLVRLEGLRCLYFARSFEQGTFYINGDEFQLPSQDCKLIPLLADEERLDTKQLSDFLESTEALALLTRLVNQGYWYLEA